MKAKVGRASISTLRAEADKSEAEFPAVIESNCGFIEATSHWISVDETKKAGTKLDTPLASVSRHDKVPTEIKLLPVTRIVPPDSGTCDGVIAKRVTGG